MAVQGAGRQSREPDLSAVPGQHLDNLSKVARSPGDFQGVADGLRELAKKNPESPDFDSPNKDR